MHSTVSCLGGRATSPMGRIGRHSGVSTTTSMSACAISSRDGTRLRTWHKLVLLQRCLWGTGAAAPRTPTLVARAVCLTMKPVGEPYAGNPHVRFDERGWETERCRMAQATAPILDSTASRPACRAERKSEIDN